MPLRLPKFWHYFVIATLLDILVIFFSLNYVIGVDPFSVEATPIIVFCWVISNALVFPTSNQRYVSFIHTYYRIVKLYALFTIIYWLVLVIFYDGWNASISIGYLKFMFFLFLLVMIEKSAFVSVIRFIRKLGWGTSQYMILAYAKEAVYFRRSLRKKTHGGYRFCCAIEEGHPFIEKNDVEEFTSVLNDHKINEIYVYPTNKKETFDFIQKVAKLSGANIFLIPIDTVKHIQFFNFRKITSSSYEEIMNGPLIIWINRMAKRIFDLIFSTVIIVFLLSWLLPILGLCIVFESKGGVFFRQTRNGRNKKQFNCLKLRTMRANDVAHSKQATRSDPRITKVGAFLRKTSLDELPQFFNVFMGDMSVVGPRPHPILLDEKFESRIPDYNARFRVKPGITGLSQAYGYRGETQKLKDMTIRIKTDFVYIQNWTLLLDVRVVFRTIRTALLSRSESAY
ncbi:MAG: hypothetical protein CL840_16945 [Crocinitomicaceae bacterium]|nr:hypothetical protein [Crocinitomicaceae bacterium]|tara:strand:- start:3286 stop:4647 length:1362 start_codon:yes stop_codon:yes gene_type:complete